MQKILNIEIKKLEELYKLDKLDELEKKNEKIITNRKKKYSFTKYIRSSLFKKKII